MPLIPRQATVDPCLRWRPSDTQRQVWHSLSRGHCSFLPGPGDPGITPGSLALQTDSLPSEPPGMDREAWRAAIQGVAKSRTRLSDFIIPVVSGGFPGGSDGKESVCNAGDMGLIPGFGILWARILEWVVMPSSRTSFQSRDRTRISKVSCIGR